MKNSKNVGILFGVGVLGIGAVIGLAQPASAQPGQDKREIRNDRKDVVDAKKDVRDDRRDIKHADNPREHHEAVNDLHRDQRDLNRQKGELNHDRRDDFHGGHGYRPGGNHPVVVERRVVVEHPIVVRPVYGHSGYSGRPGFGGSNLRTIEGRVTKDLRGNDFLVRTTGGSEVRIVQPSGESGRISRNDFVRAEGRYEGGSFVARHVQILRNR